MEKKRKSNFKKLGAKTEKKLKFNLNSVHDKKNDKSLNIFCTYNRWNSCKNLVNFVPKIFPKKSFCTPSEFKLNPPEEFHRIYSGNQVDINLFSDYDSNNSSLFDSLSNSSFEEEKKKLSFNDDKDCVNKDENKEDIKEGVNANINVNENIIKTNSMNDLNCDNKIISNFNSQNKIINNKMINLYESDKYLSILDVLLMNHK